MTVLAYNCFREDQVMPPHAIAAESAAMDAVAYEPTSSSNLVYSQKLKCWCAALCN